MKTCPICASDFEDSVEACPRHPVALRSKDKDPDEVNPLIGVVIRDRYRVTEVIGRGAMGVVYKAVQLSDDKDVAIKVLHTHLASNPESLRRFQHEASAARTLMHPHIVRLYDVNVGPGGQPYIAMEFLDGTTLSDMLRTRKWLTTKETLPIIRQVCEALAEAHSHGVLHRDIKPANIMLMERFGEENYVVVLDFSIAKVIHRASDADTTTPGLIFGSPAYMSPERFMGRGGDFRSDIYSVGIIMFQMLAGRAPFKSSDLYTLMNEHIGTVPPSIKQVRPEADVPTELEDIIARALAKKEKDRQENMKQLLAELDEVYRKYCAPKQSSSELPAINGNGSGTTGSGTTPEGSIAATSASTSSSRRDTASQSFPVFDINAGAGMNVTPSSPMPAFTSEQRKAVEEQIAMGGNFPKSGTSGNESNVSGIWSKQVAHRAQQQSATHITAASRGGSKQTAPIKLLALALVGVLGIASMIFVAMQNTGPQMEIERKIAKGELHDAADRMNEWRATRRPADDEAYASLALNLGKAFNQRRDTGEASRWLEQIPDESKFSGEAKKLLKTMRR